MRSTPSPPRRRQLDDSVHVTGREDSDQASPTQHEHPSLAAAAHPAHHVHQWLVHIGCGHLGDWTGDVANARHAPIIIGGHSKPALSRAARLGDGWVSANTDFDTLKFLIRELNALRDQHGTRDKDRFEIHGMDVAAKTVDDFRQLAEIGVTDACLVPWTMDPSATLETQLDAIRRFGDDVIAKQ